MIKLLAIILALLLSFASTGITTEVTDTYKEEEVQKYNKEIGIINRIYEIDGKSYIDVDLLEFYRGDEAVEEAKKDGNAFYDEELQEYYVYDDYYIRNTDSLLTTYEVNKNTKYYLCVYEVESDLITNSAETTEVTYEYFKNKINDYLKFSADRGSLVWLYEKNGKVYKVEKQFTP